MRCGVFAVCGLGFVKCGVGDIPQGLDFRRGERMATHRTVFVSLTGRGTYTA